MLAIINVVKDILCDPKSVDEILPIMRERILKMNADNLVSKLTRVSLSTQDSKKTGQPYTTITYHFVNGYEHRVFLNNEQIFAIKDAAKSASQSDDLLDGRN